MRILLAVIGGVGLVSTGLFIAVMWAVDQLVKDGLDDIE